MCFEYIKMNFLKKKIENLDENEIVYFDKSFVNNEEWVKCCSVYDGDTITIIKNVSDTFFKFKCRLIGIDTPELRTKDLVEKKFGYEAKKYLENLILNKFIYLKMKEMDKYGRLLIWIFLDKDDKKSVNQMMIDENYAGEYDGGKKKSYKDWKKDWDKE